MSRDRRPGRFVRVNPDADDDRVEADAGAAAQAATAAPGPDMAAILQELNALRAAVAAGAVGAAAGAGPAAAAAGPSQAAHAFACELVSPSTMLALRKAVTRYDGRVSYDVFRRDFDDLVSAYPGLTDRQQFILLSSALEKEPKSLLEDLPERSFAALDDALRMAYSKPVHAPTEMRAFFALRQLAEETLEEWSTRVSRAARRAYPDTALVRVTEYAVQQFISGLNAPDVRSAVAGCSFPTMLQALEACRLARSRCPSPPPKRARVAAVSEAIVVEGSPSSTASPAAAAPAARGAAPPPTPAPDSVEARLDRLTKQVETMVRLTQAESGPAGPAGPAALTNNGQARGRGRGRPRGSGGSRGGRGRGGSEGGCFNCGDKNHFRANCPLQSRPHPYAHPQPAPVAMQHNVPVQAVPSVPLVTVPQYYHASLSWPMVTAQGQAQGMVAAAGPAVVSMPPPSGNGK
ncbi:Retrovirus-related Pol polyprotein from transposon TNT 1-94 [Frankliniella fusca]|uniref:Retrovirus-related Pol polyprotein from transposon TNT 1-94 n=1 Tax=Frankliniella fusca TaxID=407009 RepID=A0AAE1LS37_9NEOP|nr:Retrovirus-related Pol polyprotein from transposon TNT 1-94 [Frankliniella fusca]